MEEVEKIIIHSLKEIGCVVEDEVQSLGQFTTNLIIEASVKCLELISPGLGIPEQLPQNMAARYHVGASIAEACKNMGYNGEIGYQTFLYSNVTEVRRVFMFLIDKLPKDSEKTIVEPDDPFRRLKNEIGLVIKEQMTNRLRPNNNEFQPFVSLPLESGITLPGQKMDVTPQEWRDFCINKLQFITEQVDTRHLLPSIITLNSKGNLEKITAQGKIVNPSEAKSMRDSGMKNAPESAQNTWLSMRENMLFSASNVTDKWKEEKTEEVESTVSRETVENVEENEEDLKQKELKEISTLQNRLENLFSTIKTISTQIMKIDERCRGEEISIKDKLREAEVRRKAVSLLGDGDLNIQKLEELIDTATQRLVVLANQWENYRKPLINKYREVRRSITNKASENEKQMETVRDLKEKLDSLHKQIAAKQSMRVKLEEELEKLPKDINRSAYTRRIMEIIGNIKKQREEIDKVLRDTKQLQKDINSISGRLDRSFTVTDEVIFRNAKRDDSSRRAYKLLITLHSDCSDIVSMVEETGLIVREIRDLEEQIDVESSKNTGANLERITADLQQMKVESKTLSNQLKQLSIT